MGFRKSDYDENGVDLSEPVVYEDRPPQKYYSYDDDGEIQSEGFGEVVRGEHIIPAKTTSEKPPAKADGKARVFDKSTSKWGQVNDSRGETIYDTDSQREHKIDYLGDLKENHTKSAPPSKIHKFKGGKWDLSKADRTHYLEQKLMGTIDEAHDDAQNLALGYKSTTRQVERYRDKYDRAVSGEFSPSLNKKIIDKHKAYLSTVHKRVDLIEVLRSRISTLIKTGQLERAEKIINQFEAREGGFVLDNGLDESKFAKEFEKINK